MASLLAAKAPGTPDSIGRLTPLPERQLILSQSAVLQRTARWGPLTVWNLPLHCRNWAGIGRRRFVALAAGFLLLIRMGYVNKGRAIYPGSFDPVTFGHLDIIHRASQLFDSLIVAVAQNEGKHALFAAEERMAMIGEALDGAPGVTIKKLDGLLVDFAQTEDAGVVIRGLRAVSDFEFEFQMALMNRRLEPKLETIFLTPKEDYTFLSSRIVKEVARLGGDVSPFVPGFVVTRLREKFFPAL